MRLSLLALALPLGLAAVPALAHDHGAPPPPQDWRDAPPPPGHGDDRGPGREGWDRGDGDRERARAEWLADCRDRIGARRGDGSTGALIGAAVGGVVGHEIAGRGDKLGGTLLGAGAGAVAGMAIDRSAGRRESRGGDYCEAYLERHGGGYARADHGYGPPMAYGYAYQPMMVMVPLATPMMVAQEPARPKCREVVTYDTVIDYVPAARRHIPPRAKPVYKRVPDKRIRLVPDKRIPAS